MKNKPEVEMSLNAEARVLKLSAELVKAMAELPAYPYDVVARLVNEASELNRKVKSHLIKYGVYPENPAWKESFKAVREEVLESINLKG